MALCSLPFLCLFFFSCPIVFVMCLIVVVVVVFILDDKTDME